MVQNSTSAYGPYSRTLKFIDLLRLVTGPSRDYSIVAEQTGNKVERCRFVAGFGNSRQLSTKSTVLNSTLLPLPVCAPDLRYRHLHSRKDWRVIAKICRGAAYAVIDYQIDHQRTTSQIIETSLLTITASDDKGTTHAHVHNT